MNNLSTNSFEKLVDKFIKTKNNDKEKEWLLVSQLERMRDGNVKPGSKNEQAIKTVMKDWTKEHYNKAIEEIKTRTMDHESIATAADIIVSLAQVDPASLLSKEVLNAYTNDLWKDNQNLLKAVKEYLPQGFTTKDFFLVVEKIKQLINE